VKQHRRNFLDNVASMPSFPVQQGNRKEKQIDNRKQILQGVLKSLSNGTE
jgi:hypothetical protein